MRRLTACWVLMLFAGGAARAQLRTGASAYGDWTSDAPGVLRKITAADLPPPYAKPSASAPPGARPSRSDGQPKAPPGFSVQRFVRLQGPRVVRVAPNGDIFVAETGAGQISVLRAGDGAARPSVNQVFAKGLDQPFGIAFYPLGPDPRWIYVATPNSVLRFAYASGDLKARGPRPRP